MNTSAVAVAAWAIIVMVIRLRPFAQPTIRLQSETPALAGGGAGVL
jgi:hypothetical protein